MDGLAIERHFFLLYTSGINCVPVRTTGGKASMTRISTSLIGLMPPSGSV